MKRNKAYLRNELHLSQEEMAMVLNTKRMQLALYELALRDLPKEASTRFLALSLFMKTAQKPQTKDFPKLEEEKEKFLAKALEDCKYYQIGCNRKIPKMKEAYQKALKLLQLIDYLKEQTNEEALHPGAISILKEKAQKILNKNGPIELLKLKLRLQLLQTEEVLLKSLIERNRIDSKELE